MMNQRVRDVLRGKGEDVYSVAQLATVIDAVNVMNDHHVGSVLVMENGHTIGIFSERDVLVRCAATTRLHTASLDDNLLDVMKLMTDHRCLHIRVMEGDMLVGVISIGDVTKAMESNLRQEVRELSNYIGG
ncbi:MAG: CBS domain-containing protein, partial [Deltaproteobacteria bacterium]|nr:CBS domain-containing protein [Deltaproteobacteria bacterium]